MSDRGSCWFGVDLGMAEKRNWGDWDLNGFITKSPSTDWPRTNNLNRKRSNWLWFYRKIFENVQDHSSHFCYLFTTRNDMYHNNELRKLVMITIYTSVILLLCDRWRWYYSKPVATTNDKCVPAFKIPLKEIPWKGAGLRSYLDRNHATLDRFRWRDKLA